MRLRGVDFGIVWDASGVRGFYEEGYPYHRYFRPLGLDLADSTFVSKTITLEPRDGNLPYHRCVIVKPLKGVGLNAVGLPNLGAQAHFDDGRWQSRMEPFFISFAPVGRTSSERIRETKEFVAIFLKHLSKFKAPVGLQINISCPNTGSKAYDDIVQEVNHILDIAGQLGIPIILKFNIVTPPEVVYQISQNPNCDGICVSNTIPFGQLPEFIDWEGLFGSQSPLAHLGGGGLSGKPLLSLVENWVKEFRKLEYKKYINAGGGILSAIDADKLFLAGADSVFLGSIAFLRPWRVKNIVATFNGL